MDTANAETADTSMSDTSSVFSDDDPTRYFKVAIDFGTTCSSVAYLHTGHRPEPHHRRLVRSDEVRLITGFPDSARNDADLQNQQRDSVPSQCWYGPKATAKAARKRGGPNATEAMPAFDKEIQDYLLNESEQIYQWGYGVRDHIKRCEPGNAAGVYLYNLKLWLDRSKETETPRAHLKAGIDKLRYIRPIKNEIEPIIEYLSHLLKYSREYLAEEAGFQEDCRVEFIICVPAAWNAQATMRMQQAFEVAIQRSAFLGPNHPSMRNLFFISEPEAASMCVLENGQGQLKRGDTFVVIDAGGGTVDATCYTLANERPLRLQREETMAEGVLCGSSYLNFELRKVLRNKLTTADFEPASGDLDQIIERTVFEFEYGLKRTIDVYKNKPLGIFIRGLRRNVAKQFDDGKMFLTSTEWHQLFEYCLTGIGNLLLRQIEAARARSLNLKKVVMIGGFSDSPSLRRHIEMELTKYNNEHGTMIKRVQIYTASTAVAQGAVLRSLRKDYGPDRIVQFSYGFVTDEEYSPDNDKEEIRIAHADAKITIDRDDRAQIVKDTIWWIIQKGQTLEPIFVYRYYQKYFFGKKHRKFSCTIEVFMSDQKCESHYHKRHEKNKSAQSVMTVEADMTFLKDDGHIQPTFRVRPNSNNMTEVWEVEFDLVMMINGRNLRFEARWPPVSMAHGRLIGEHPGKVMQTCELSLAGAFAHGTA